MRRLGGHRLWLLLLGALGLALSYLPLGDRLEGELYQLLVRALPLAEGASGASVVAIDEASLLEYGPWPWPAERQASLLAAVESAGARAIGLALPAASRGQLASQAARARTVPPGVMR